MEQEDSGVLVFAGAQTLRNVSESADLLKEFILGGGPRFIDCSEIEDVDVSFIQLLLAARRSVAGQGRVLRLTSPAKGALLACLRNAGLLSEQPVGEASREFWLSGGGK